MKNTRRSSPAINRPEDVKEMEDANVTTNLLRAVARTKGKAEKLMIIYIINSFRNYSQKDGTKFYDGDGKPMLTQDVPQEIKNLGAHIFVDYKDFLETLKKDSANANISRRNIFKIIENTKNTAETVIAVDNSRPKEQESESKNEPKSKRYLHINLIRAIGECGDNMTDVIIDPYVIQNMEAFGETQEWTTLRTEMKNVAKLSNGKAAGLYLEAKATLKEYPTRNKTTHNRAFFEIVIPWYYLRKDMDLGDKGDQSLQVIGGHGFYCLKKSYILKKIQKAIDEIEEKTDLVFQGKPWFSRDDERTKDKKTGKMELDGNHPMCVHFIVSTRKTAGAGALAQRLTYTNEENPRARYITPPKKAEEPSLLEKIIDEQNKAKFPKMKTAEQEAAEVENNPRQ